MLSRAKEQLVIIGNSTTLSSDINLSPIIDYLFDNAECLDLNDFIWLLIIQVNSILLQIYNLLNL